MRQVAKRIYKIINNIYFLDPLGVRGVGSSNLPVPTNFFKKSIQNKYSAVALSAASAFISEARWGHPSTLGERMLRPGPPARSMQRPQETIFNEDLS